jgi:nitroimidazol reductase NimA-like FMN-containing flavoprotein (pyridoxamine 5'-phosphate oxidase superfamily)
LSIVKLSNMSDDDMEELIGGQVICRIAFNGEEYPYLIPFQYVLIDGTPYFHFTNYGKKMRLLERDNRVCVQIESYRPDLSEYNFVALRGTLKVVSDPVERAKAISRMAEVGKRRLSNKFLAAHGFEPEAGWSVFTPSKPLVIVKLDEVTEKIGLKSPS